MLAGWFVIWLAHQVLKGARTGFAWSAGPLCLPTLPCQLNAACKPIFKLRPGKGAFGNTVVVNTDVAL